MDSLIDDTGRTRPLTPGGRDTVGPMDGRRVDRLTNRRALLMLAIGSVLVVGAAGTVGAAIGLAIALFRIMSSLGT